MKHLVIGYKGEVGSAILRILSEVYDVQGIDRESLQVEPWRDYDFLHICIPYNSEFSNSVEKYKREWLKDDGITIIHSTIPVGISRNLDAVHSPIHGIHPNLYEGVKTFIKFIGAVNSETAHRVLEMYRGCGIKGYIVDNPETSELSKLGCTTRHGLAIVEQKEFKKLCDKNGVNFEQAYTLWNRFYSNGYEELGKPYLRRMCVKDMPGKIGGHCILQNLELIGGSVAEFVKKQNEGFE